MALKINQLELDNLTTTERNALVNPPKGTLIYNTTLGELEVNDGTPGVPVWTPASIANIDADDVDDASTTNKFVTAGDLTNLGNLSGTNSGDEVQGTTSVIGIWEAGTVGEIDTGTDVTKVVTVDGLAGSQLATDVSANNSKVSNVDTALSVGTKTATTLGITSDGGTDDVVLPQATITEAGLLAATDQVKLNNTSGTNTGDQTSIVGITGTKAQFDTAVTDGDFLYVGDVTSNVTTNLSIGTKTGTTVDINSSDGTNATIPQATITEAGLISAADQIKVNNLSGTNTGDVSLAGTPDYITIVGQTITRNAIDLAADVTGTLPVANGGTGSATQNFWDLTTNQTSAGTKTMSAAIPLNFTNVAAQIQSVGNVNFMRGTAGKSKITLTANGANNAEFQMLYGSDANANNILIQLAASTQLNFGSSVSKYYINTTNSDIDTVIRGAVDDNLIFADAGLDAVGIGTAPNAVAKLDVSSTTKGVLLPRMTATQASAITPVNGLMLYTTSTNGTFTNIGYWTYENGTWVSLTASGGNTNSKGSMYISTSAATTISTVNTPVKVNATAYTAENLTDFTESVDGRLRYDGTTTRVFDVTTVISMIGSTNNIYSFYIAKNGSVLSQTQIERKLGVGGDVGALSVIGSVELATNDYVEIFVENNTGTGNPTISKMYTNIK